MLSSMNSYKMDTLFNLHLHLGIEHHYHLSIPVYHSSSAALSKNNHYCDLFVVLDFYVWEHIEWNHRNLAPLFNIYEQILG